MSERKPAVVARDLSKNFYLTKDGEERGLSLKRNRRVVEALKPTSFVVYKGESVGIVGRNGSGKSTLFEIVAGIENPSTGSVLVAHKPTLLSVGAALQSHLNAYDNVRLGLLAKGMNPESISEIQQSVVQWADIGEAAHRPLRSYSSGMAARLKFSIATAVRSEILLIDEALATGDAAFNGRAARRMQEMLDEASTIFMVSHSIATIRQQCTRVMWLHNGDLIADGSPRYVTQMYQRWSDFAAARDRKRANQLLRRMSQSYKPKRIILDSEAARILDGHCTH